MGKRTIIYGRVSTSDQSERGYSLPSQFEACRKYADAHDCSVVAEIQDDISGAVPFRERPGGRQVCGLLDRREADAVMVHQVDRLSRDIIDLLQTCRDWLRNDVGIYAGDTGWVKSELDIVLVIKGWQSSDERKRIVERTKRGRDSKARAGKVVGAGPAPYGYRYDNGAFHVIEDEAAVVRAIYEWYVRGKNGERPLAMLAIARELSAMGVPTPGESRGHARTRKRGMWDDGTIRNILARETYVGIWRWGKTKGTRGRGGKRPTSETIPVEVPAIVSRELYQAAQDRRAYNKRMSRRNTRHNYLLRGMVTCGCGGAMSGSAVRTQNQFYYRCTNGRAHFADLGEKRCNRQVNARVLERLAWGYILEVMRDSKRFERGLYDAQEAEWESLEPKRARLTTVENLIRQCETQAAGLAKALASVPGGIVGQTLQHDIETCNERHAILTRERDKLLTELDAERLSDVDIKAALEFREAVLAGMETATFEDKRLTLEDLRCQVLVTDGRNGQAVVSCRIPVDCGVFDLNTSKNSGRQSTCTGILKVG